MKIFPYALLRLGGLPFNRLENLRSESLNESIQSVVRCEESLDSVIEQTCSTLFSEVSFQKDIKKKQVCIDLKRRVYNRKTINDLQQLKDQDFLREEAITAIDTYINHLNILSEKQKQYTQQYDLILSQSRRNLQEIMISEKAFLNGVLLSSSSLLDAAYDYLFLGKETTERNLHHIELSMLKYLSRTVAKTSPFSTFTRTAFPILKDPKKNLPDLDIAALKTISAVTLNNNILAHLKKLLLRYPPFYKSLHLKLNGTVKYRDNQLVFFVNISNTETFQTVQKSDLTDVIMEIFSHKDTRTFINIQHQIISQFDIDLSRAQHVIMDLVDNGILQFIFDVDRNDKDWHNKLCRLINKLSIADDHLLSLADGLQEIFKLSRSFEIATEVSERKKILDQIHKILFDKLEVFYQILDIKKYDQNNKQIADNTHQVTKHRMPVKAEIKRENLIYEDTFLSDKMKLNRSKIETVIKTLEKLRLSLSFLDSFTRQKRSIYEIYIKLFPSDNSVPILDFFEAYERYKEVVKDAIFTSSIDAELDLHIDKQLTQFLGTATRTEDGAYNISSKDLEFIDDNTVLSLDKTVSESYSVFVQIPFDSTNNILNNVPVVINSDFVGGHAKLMTRFLNVESNEPVLKSARKYCLGNYDYVFAEYDDDSYFNANLHPLITEHEFEHLNGANKCKPENILKLRNISIVPDEERKSLSLIELGTGKRIYFLDLAFQDGRTRSSFYRFLSYFSNQGSYSYFPVVWRLSQELKVKSSDDSVTVIPRITFDNGLILKRKTWEISPDSFPIVSSKERKDEVHAKIIQWRLKLKLPAQVFISFEKNSEKFSRRDAKPQFIDFDSPYFVLLFYRFYLCDKDISKLIIVEFFPNQSNMMSYNSEQYVSEFLLQWH